MWFAVVAIDSVIIKNKEDQVLLVHFLNLDGINTVPAFLLYYLPAYLDNCIKNADVKLSSACKLLVSIWTVLEAMYSDKTQGDVGNSLPVITGHIGEY